MYSCAVLTKCFSGVFELEANFDDDIARYKWINGWYC